VSFLTVDIETVPQARYADPDNYVEGEGEALDWDPEWANDYFRDHGTAIHDAIEAGEAVLAATKVTPALHPTTCHIVQVSFGWRAPMGNQSAELHRRVLQINDYFIGAEPSLPDAERPLVYDAIDLLAGACQKGTTIVSFNGKQFDLPVLRARAALLRAKVPPVPWRRLLYPYADDRHADLRLILSADGRRARGTLQWWAEAFGIHAEEHGAEVWGWVRAGEWGKLGTYGLTEAQTLVELYEAVQAVL
jgi:hypothetical protein